MKLKLVKPAREFSNPTAERIKQAGGHYVIGDERGERRIMTLRDAPLERCRDTGAITEGEYNAGKKFAHHWYHAGLAGNIHTLDLNRVFAAADTGCGMARSEGQAFHRQQYRAAVEELGILNSAVVTRVVCDEEPLAKVAAALGWFSESRGREAMERVLRRALDKLERFWG